MPWSGSPGSKTFARTNGTYTGQQVWAQDSAANTKITSLNHDTHDQDLATGINTCLTKDGSNSATADLPMGGNKLTNVGVATALSHYARMDQVQNGAAVYVPTVGGTSNAITLTTGWSSTAYVAGQTYRFIAASSNSDAVTINVDGLGAKNVVVGSTALTSAQILASTMIEVTYDGASFQLVASAGLAAPAAIGVGAIMAWPAGTVTVPTGWLECDGSAVSRSTYSGLFARISTRYGSGDGSTTFNLPDYRGKFLRGYDHGAGNDPDVASRTNRGDGTTGDAVGTKQGYATASHTHTGSGTTTGESVGHTHSFSATTSSDGAHTHTVIALDTTNPNGGATGGALARLNTITTSSNGAHTHTVSGTSGDVSGDHTHNYSFTTSAPSDTTSTESRPINITVMWIMLAVPAAAIAIGTGFTRTPRLIHTGGIPARVSTDGTNTTPSISETYIAEVFVPGPGSVTVTGVSIFNGDANAGNVNVGIANSQGAAVAQSGSVAASGTDSYQRVPFTATVDLVGPATYYVLLQNSSASNRFNSHTFGDFGASKKTGETFGTFTTISIPSTFTTGLGPIASLY